MLLDSFEDTGCENPEDGNDKLDIDISTIEEYRENVDWRDVIDPDTTDTVLTDTVKGSHKVEDEHVDL